jgi:hypothetical protein
MVGPILQRHPEWQVDTAWAGSEHFTLGAFGEWYFNQGDSADTTADNSATEQGSGSSSTTSVDHPVTTSTDVAARPSQNTNTAGEVGVEPSDASLTATKQTANDNAGGAANTSSPVFVAWADSRIGNQSRSVLGAVDARGETQASHTDGAFTANRLDSVATYSSVASGLMGDVVADAGESPLVYQATALVLASPEMDASETQPSLSGFGPHAAGLHTALSAFDVPVFDLGAWGEQVAEFMNTLTASETTMIVASCAFVLLAAGAGGEILRRQYRRTRPQMVLNAPGAVVLDLSLIA